MGFFANSTDFKITGGNFNSIAGNLNQHFTTHTTYTSNSYNNNPNGGPSHPYYHPYAPKLPRDRPSPRRPQYQHEEYGEYGHARYYDDLPPQSGSQYGGYEDLGHSRSRFEASMRSPDHHVEVIGGEFDAVRRGARGRASTDDSQASMDVDAENTNVEENAGDRADALSDTTSDDETDATDATLEEPIPLPETSVPAVAVVTPDLPQSPRERPLYEKMRMSMAGLDINGDQTQAGDAPPSLPSDISSEGKLKSARSPFRFVNILPGRTKDTP